MLRVPRQEFFRVIPHMELGVILVESSIAGEEG